MSKRQHRHGLLPRATAMARRGMTAALMTAGVLVVGGACGTHSKEEGSAVSQLPPAVAMARNAQVVDEHHIPAANVPVPSPVAWSPQPVVEPPNPIAERRPLDNPGGFNGDRPARPVLGLAGATPAKELRTLDIMPEETESARRGPPADRPLATANGTSPSARLHFGPRWPGLH